MIFLVVFGLIAVIVILLNIKDSSNLEKIENYLKSKNCINIIYSKGDYKGICPNEIIEISNSFSVDLEKNKRVFKFDKIKTLEKENLEIIINKTYNIEFKEKEKMEIFYKSLKEKID